MRVVQLILFASSAGTLLTTVSSFSACRTVSTPLLERNHLAKQIGMSGQILRVPPRSSTHLNLFGNLFGSDDSESDDGDSLATITNLSKSKDDVDIAYDSLTIYLEDWANLFEGEGGKQRGLTTLVSVSPYSPAKDGDEEVIESKGVKLIFKPPKNEYFSKSEERAKEEGGSSDQKKKEVSPGGVQVVAEKIAGGSELRVVASRCDIEEGTVIKEMSEETIVDDLREAIKIWKAERKG